MIKVVVNISLVVELANNILICGLFSLEKINKFIFFLH